MLSFYGLKSQNNTLELERTESFLFLALFIAEGIKRWTNRKTRKPNRIFMFEPGYFDKKNFESQRQLIAVLNKLSSFR